MAALRCLALPALLAALVAAGGCASPAEPTARHAPVIPTTIQDLQARQQGDAVLLTFTLPKQSTRNQPLAAPPAIEVLRGSVEAGKVPQKTSLRTIYTIPGEMTASYASEAKILYRDAIAAGTGGESIYAIRTRAERNKASAESNRVVVRVGPAPAAVANASGRVSGRAVVLTWPRDGAANYRVYKAEIAPESAAAAASDPAKATVWRPLVQVAQIGGTTGAGTPALVQYEDEDVEFSHSYMYYVRRTEQSGNDTIESADVKAVVITVAVANPPAVPQDVEAIVVPATGAEPAYVSLSWALSNDAGVAGYAVYRSEEQGARGARLNQELARAPTYRDATVAAGRRYFYRVTAIASDGLESEASEAFETQIPPAQP